MRLADTLVQRNMIDEAREIRDRVSPVMTRVLGPDHEYARWINDPKFLIPRY